MSSSIYPSRGTRVRALSLSVATALATTSPFASAAFFQLQENNVSGLGSAYSGGAAIAEDASTVWYNPAGMTRLPEQQVLGAGHFIKPSSKFSKTSANLSPTLGGGALSGGNGGDAGEAALVPNFYYTRPLDKRLFFGFGLNVPFGLATDYDDDWVGRYHANRSEIKTVNLNPALAYQFNEQWSIGGGLNYQHLDATLTQAVDYGSICALAGIGACSAPGANDGSARMQADGDAWGFNLGGLWQLGHTRVGAHYRSKMKYKLKGTSTYSAPSATAAAVAASAPFNITNAGVRVNATLPATFSLSLHQQVASSWALTGDITRTYWSKLPELRIDFDSSQGDSVVTLNLKDVNRYSLGTSYAPGGSWTYRAGIALDQSPSRDATHRTARLPDNDRRWLTLGAGYQQSPTLGFDVGYAYIKAKDAPINKQAGTNTAGEDFLRGSLVGTYKATVHILSAQADWKF